MQFEDELIHTAIITCIPLKGISNIMIQTVKTDDWIVCIIGSILFEIEDMLKYTQQILTNTKLPILFSGLQG